MFAETGLVVTPFLPGDSLLFAVGALSATGVLNPWFCYVLLIGAAILGDGVNYSVGRRIGPRLLGRGEGPAFSHRLINPQHIKRAHEFFELHGGKRSSSPGSCHRATPAVVAGAAEMNAASFLHNIRGHRLGHHLKGADSCSATCVIKEKFTLVTIDRIRVGTARVRGTSIGSAEAAIAPTTPPRTEF